jgi:hypothetical protein
MAEVTILWHRTTRKAARWILARGFRDATSGYMTGRAARRRMDCRPNPLVPTKAPMATRSCVSSVRLNAAELGFGPDLPAGR